MEIDWAEVGRILSESANRPRHHAGFFHWHEKSLKEWGIAQGFREELERDGVTTIISSKQHPGGKNHAPDYEFTTDGGAVWGIEITELVDQEAIETAQRGKRLVPDWSDEELLAAIETLIDKKDRPKNVRGGPYDRYILLVHSDEDMLAAQRIQAVIGGRQFSTCLIDDIYVLVSYDPAEGRLPLLRFGTVRAA
jgi:hypothetical protein